MKAICFFTQLAFLICALAATSGSVHALEVIDTDGPDFVESSEVVAPGHFQVEVDFTSASDSRASPGPATLSTPTLLKYGIARNLEIRLAPGGYMVQNGVSGWGDTALGVKWHAQDRDTAQSAPAVSWILHVEAPSGVQPFRGHALRPSLRSVITWELPHDLALGLMPGIKSDTGDDGHRYTSLIFGAVLNKRLGEVTRVFVELAAPQVASSSDGGVVASWDVGAACLLSADLQLGFRAGVAATPNAPGSFVVLELAQRF
jgi:hypothetical protein